MKFIATDDEGYWGHDPDAQYGRALRAASAHSRLQTSHYALGDPNDPSVPFAAVVQYPPNWAFPRHSHASPRLEVIITGSIIIDDRVFGPGSIMTSDKDEFYGPHTVGPEGCMTVEVMNGLGARLLTFSTPAGDKIVNLDDPDAMRSLEAAFPNP
jgi:hypothetical protein